MEIGKANDVIYDEFIKFISSHIKTNQVDYFDEYFHSCFQVNQTLKTKLENRGIILDWDLYRDVIFGLNFTNNDQKFQSGMVNYYLLALFLVSKGISWAKINHLHHADLTRLFKKLRRKNDPNFYLNHLESIIKYHSFKVGELIKNHEPKSKIKKFLHKRRAAKMLLINKVRDFKMKYEESKYRNIFEYRKACEFNISENELKSIKGYEILRNFGWYHLIKNPFGVTKDHRISVYYGFVNDINPEFLKHPANCEFLTMRQNSSKNSNCSISLEELRLQMKKFKNIS